MEYDVEKVMVTNEQQSGVIVQQRRELESQNKTIRHLKNENESLRKSIGVLRFRLWQRDVDGVIPKGDVVVQHGWADELASYRTLVIRMPKEQPNE